MGRHVQVARIVALAALSVSVLWLTGCGSSSEGPGTQTRLVGTVEAPAGQVARAGALDGLSLARLFTIGSRAEAAPPVARQRVRGATVTVTLLENGVQLGIAGTGQDGTFTLPLSGVAAGALCQVTVRAQGAYGQQIRLRALVRLMAGQTTCTVNEATTVGAEAGETVADDGADDDTILAIADEVADAQEGAEAQDPGAIPSLADNEPAHVQLHQRAHAHLTANLGAKLQAVLSGGTAPQPRQIHQAIMAAQAYARLRLGLAPSIHLSPAQVAAIAAMTTNGRTFTALEIANALVAAGVEASGVDVTENDVKAALTVLINRDDLKALLSSVTDDKVPAIVALLAVEQANSANVAFHIETQEQLNAFISALAGTTVSGPDGRPMGPHGVQ
ncbi:MAG: hypothetical protein HY321_10915 [Armatimonadetes bacterium]|nr:hypothetical protein [Armatimonadota bacterium]